MRRCGDGARERARCTVGDSRRETPAQPRSRGAPPLLPRQPDHPRRRARLSLKIWTGLASWAEGPRAEKATPPSSPRPLVTEDLDGSDFLGGKEGPPAGEATRPPSSPRPLVTEDLDGSGVLGGGSRRGEAGSLREPLRTGPRSRSAARDSSPYTSSDLILGRFSLN